uniref:Uncharacterized protein n=1 Tax=Graphocephala atropunctata TaxID=36148 RepID=A0A1B6LDL8_9HEMI
MVRRSEQEQTLALCRPQESKRLRQLYESVPRRLPRPQAVPHGEVRGGGRVVAEDGREGEAAVRGDGAGGVFRQTQTQAALLTHSLGGEVFKLNCLSENLCCSLERGGF